MELDGMTARWQNHANCLGVNPDLFYPERGESTREAKAVCKACDVRPDCLEYALKGGEKFGIWGGTSERERRRIRRERKKAGLQDKVLRPWDEEPAKPVDPPAEPEDEQDHPYADVPVPLPGTLRP